MITQELKDKGVHCRGQGFNCYNCKNKNECVEYEYNDKMESFKKQSNSELLVKLLNNSRVESIMIEYERIGDVERSNIKAKLKEAEKSKGSIKKK